MWLRFHQIAMITLYVNQIQAWKKLDNNKIIKPQYIYQIPQR